jgi:hypothetical protein
MASEQSLEDKNYNMVEDFILKHVSLDGITGEGELQDRIMDFYKEEERRVHGKANILRKFADDKYWEGGSHWKNDSKIQTTLINIEQRVDTTLTEIDNIQTFDDLKAMENRYGNQDRFKTQIKVVEKRLNKISNDQASDAIDKISNASKLELTVIDPNEYSGRVTDNALRRIKSAFNERKKELYREGEL